MARILCCVHCRAVLEEIMLADRSVVVVCIGCEMIGNAREVALGAPLIAAEFGLLLRRAGGSGKTRARPRQSARAADRRRAAGKR